MQPSASHVVRVLGGRASYRQVVAHTSRAALRRDLETGAVLRVRRGVYAVPELPPADAVAAQTGGVVSHLSAARVLGLELPFPDDRVHVTVGPSSRVPRRSSVAVHWNRLAAGEVEGSTTTALRTVLDCARVMSFPQALAVADSALRRRLVHPDELGAAARAVNGPGRSACLRVAAWADPAASNAFESVLRGTLVAAGLTDLVPQLAVALPRFTVHCDLGDPRRRLALEADSFTYHATREAFSRDCERYDELVSIGWRVLRFTWEQVMFEPDWVVDAVRRTRALRRSA